MVPCIGLAALVEQDDFVDAVIIPLVVWRHLIAPLCNASVEVTREDGHGPLVVARTSIWIPDGLVPGTVVDQVGLGIIRPPAPVITTTVLSAQLGRAVVGDRVCR